MNLKEATKDDVEQLVKLSFIFAYKAGSPTPNKEDLVGFYHWLVSDSEGAAFLSEKGFIAGFIAPLWCNRSYRQAHELAWYSEDRQGLKLLGAFEDWCLAKNVNEIRMSTLDPFSGDRVEKVLARRGFEKKENSFVRKT